MKNNNLQIKAIEKSDLIKLAEGERNDKFALSFYLGLKSNINFRSEANSILSGEAKRIKKENEYSKSSQKKILSMLDLVKKEINYLRLSQEARALVFFFREKSKIKIYRVPVYVRSKIVIEADYYIDPLVKITEEFSRYLAVAVERNKAEFFIIFWGKIEGKPEVIFSDVPKKIRTSTSDDWKGRRERKIERHIEDHLKRHFKTTALKIRDYSKGEGFDHLIIGGHEEIKAKFQEFLDKKSAEKMIGFFSLPHPKLGAVIEKSMKIINEHEKNVEEKIARDIMGSIGGKRWSAVVGIDSVLEHFYLHKIKIFVLGANFKKSGFVCGNCHHIYLLPGTCSLCGGKTARANNLIDEIMEEAINNKIKIRQLFYSHKNFDRFGIGAFLKEY